MKKFLGILAFVVSALFLTLAILRVVRKKQETRNLVHNDLGFVSTERRYEAPMCCTPGASK